MKVTEKTVEEFKTIGSTTFDKKKTEELMEDMREQGIDVSIENLSQYLKQQGVLVDVHVGGGVREYGLSVKAYGIDKDNMGEEANELFTEHVKNGKLSFLPSGYDKKRKRLASNLRMTRDRQSIGYDNKFLTIEAYKEYYKFFLETKEEYFALKDELMDKYDELVSRFKQLVYTTLKEMNAIDLENEYSKLTARFGTVGTRQYENFKQDYAQGFYMSLNVKAFPVVENLDIFETDIRNQIQDGISEDSVRALYEIIGNTLNDAFQAVGGIIKASNNGNDTIFHKTMKAVKESYIRIAQKNVFANKKINEIRNEMAALTKFTDFDMTVEEAEHIVSKIYAYAMELKIEEMIDLKGFPLTKDELLLISGLIIADDEPEEADASFLFGDEEELEEYPGF